MVAGGFRIVQLADAPDALPTLARWFVAEWAPYYGPGGPGDATADLEGCRNRDALPIALVALDDDGAVVGTAALKAESVGSEQAAGPWLAAFVVGRAHRRRGVGTALAAAVEAEARRLGHAALYCSTDVADDMLKRCGWRAHGVTQSLRGAVRIYRVDLDAGQPERRAR